MTWNDFTCDVCGRIILQSNAPGDVVRVCLCMDCFSSAMKLRNDRGLIWLSPEVEY